MTVENKNDGLEDEGVQGGADGNASADDGKNETGSEGSGAGEGTEGGEKTLPQSEVTRMMAREKKQGRNAGRNAAYKELGINPDDKEAVDQVKNFIAFLSQQQADEGAANDAASAAIAEAEERAAVAEMKAEAMQQGVKREFVDDLVTLARARMGEDADVKTIIGEYRTKYPVWFGEAPEDEGAAAQKEKVGQKGTGASVKPSQSQAGKGEEGIGARLAASRKRSGGKSSFWDN